MLKCHLLTTVYLAYASVFPFNVIPSVLDRFRLEHKSVILGWSAVCDYVYLRYPLVATLGNTTM